MHVAVEAFSRLAPDAVHVVVGGPSGSDGGAYLAQVRAQASELGVLDRIRFEPAVHASSMHETPASTHAR